MSLLPVSCVGCGVAGVLWCGTCDASVVEAPPLPAVVRPAVVVGAYTGPLRRGIGALKYRGATAAAVPFGRRLARLLADGGLGDVDAVVAVPTSAPRRRSRGYDQASLLAAAVATALGTKQAALLVRPARSVPQQELGRAERLRAVPHRFLLERAPPARVLVVDDVLTTGATLASALAVLRAHGAEAVAAAVAATPGANGPARRGSSGPEENVPSGED